MNSKEDIDSLIRNHFFIKDYPNVLRAYNEGYVTAEQAYAKLEEATERELNPSFPLVEGGVEKIEEAAKRLRAAAARNTTINVSFESPDGETYDDDTFYVKRDGKVLSSFNKEDNIGDVLEGVIDTLTALDFNVEHDF
jgi:hypothetical protein